MYRGQHNVPRQHNQHSNLQWAERRRGVRTRVGSAFSLNIHEANLSLRSVGKVSRSRGKVAGVCRQPPTVIYWDSFFPALHQRNTQILLIDMLYWLVMYCILVLNSRRTDATSGRWDPANDSRDPLFTLIGMCLYNSTFNSNLLLQLITQRFDKMNEANEYSRRPLFNRGQDLVSYLTRCHGLILPFPSPPVLP